MTCVATAGRPVDWLTSPAPIAYPAAMAWMDERVAAIRRDGAPEAVWLLEHPALYTAGTSARDDELLDPHRFPVFRTGRGGRFTYHGPGQRVVYVMFDLSVRGADVRRFVRTLEGWVIDSLRLLGVDSDRREGRTGVWVRGAGGADAKIAALGVRVRRWVTCHGIAINVAPNLSHFDGIVPCGLAGYRVTSLAGLGVAANFPKVDAALAVSFRRNLGDLAATNT